MHLKEELIKVTKEMSKSMNVVESDDGTKQTKTFRERRSHSDPFEFMRIENNQYLNDIDGRVPCPKCSKSRKYFCYTCYVPVQYLDSRLPKVQLPVQIDIIKHQREIDGKSTAIHAAILAPENVNMYTYPDIPDYNSVDGETVSKTFSDEIFGILIL